MIVFEELSREERRSACAAVNATMGEKQKIIADCIKGTLSFISAKHGTRKAVKISRKIAVGNYLINNPEEVADYCIKLSEVAV